MIKHYILTLTILFAAAEETTVSSNITTLYAIPTNTAHNETQQNLSIEESTPNPLKIDTASSLQQAKELSTSWKIEASYTKSNLTEYDIRSESKRDNEEKNEVKEFKPSPHLGSFFDEESAEIIKEPIVNPVKKPASFVSSPKDVFKTNFKKPPKKIFETHQMFPYKFESPFYSKVKGNWLSEDPIESKPTVQVPVETPAGGFYQHPEPFNDVPLNSEEYMPNAYEEGKEVMAPKRNPWTGLLQILTAFLPVGLIISALTPSVITIDTVGNGSPYPSNPFRRSEPGIEDVAPLSEECRRRLLCELRSEIGHGSSPGAPKKMHCYKIFCEDLGPLWRMLQWLLSHQPIGSNDQRARIIS